MKSMRLKLTGAALLLVVLIAAPSMFAWYSLQQGQILSERSRMAHEVLEEHLILATAGHELLNYIALGGSTSDRQGKAMAQVVNAELADVRRMITAEIAFLGAAGLVEEEEELARVDRIDASLRSAIAGNDDGKWMKEISAAVAEERREVAVIDQQTARSYRSVSLLMAATALAVFLVVFLGLVWMQRTIVRPIASLIDGMRNLAEGRLSFRLREIGSGELQVLNADFNRMAVQVHASAKSMENDRNALIEIVEQRTEQLTAANEALRRAADRRAQFLADISHELRTPLAIIRGEAEVALRGADKSTIEYRESLSRVTGQVNSMVRLVDDLLYVARNEGGVPKFIAKPLSLKSLLNQIVRDLKPLIEADNGKIKFNADNGPAQIMGDADRLRQLMTILLDNAIHYSEGPPDIEVALVQSTEGYAVIVRDHGIGIAEDELPHVFERYRRGNHADAHNGHGVGIGLPMAKAIAETHGGSLRIDSVEHEGTTVTLLLPASGGMRVVA
jgi:two-component system, OmpR family, sensor kinase